MTAKIESAHSAIGGSKQPAHNFAGAASNHYMESNLVIKNFGPITHVNLDLRNVNVFIGPQASGKSAIAKIYTIFKAPRKFFKIEASEDVVIENKKVFANALEEYNIASFLKTDTEIGFDSQLHEISYKNGTIRYTARLLKKIEELEGLAQNFEHNRERLLQNITELRRDFILFDIDIEELLPSVEDESILANFDKGTCLKIFEIIKETEEYLSVKTALYIPAERTLSNIIKKSSLNLQINNVPIPRHILSFGAELEKIDVQKLDLNFIQQGMYFENMSGEDRIYTGGGHSIKLAEAASGIQSVLPILLPVLAKKDVLSHQSFVIEEPELNLFPLAQYDLIQYLEASRSDSRWEDFGTIHTYTTHSPYILSALNNLLYAYKVMKTLSDSMINENINTPSAILDEIEIDFYKKIDSTISEIVKIRINPTSFSAYQIANGTAEPIFNRETGLIDENFIDDASDKINDDFDKLMELMK